MATTVASNVAPKSPRNRRLRVKSVTSIGPSNLNGNGSNLIGRDGNVSASASANSRSMSPKAYSTGSRVGTIALPIERRDPSKSPRPNRQTLGIHSPRTPVLAKNYLLEEETNSPSKLSSLKSPHSIRSPAGESVVGDEQRRRKAAESPRTSRKTTVVSRQDIRQYVKARNRHIPGELNMVSINSPASPVEELEESIPIPLERKEGEVRSSSPRTHTSREHHRHHSSSPRKLHANQKSPRQNIDFNESHIACLEAEDTDKYLSTLMKELHRHTEQHREPLSDQAMIQLHLSRTQQLQGPGQGPEEEGEAEDNRIMMTLWEMKEQFRRDFPSAPMPSDAALKQRYKILGLVRTAKSSFTSQNDSFSNVVQGSNSKSMDHLSALNPSSSYSDRVTSTAMVTTKHFGDNSPVARVPVAIPWLDREDNQDNDGSSLEKNAGESEDASPQTHRKSGVTSFKNLASRVALAAKIVKSSNKTLETNKGHNDVEDHEQREEGANAKSRKGKKDKVEEKLKKKEEKQLKKIEKAKQKLARAQRELEKEKRPTKINDDDTKTIHDEHEAKVDSESTMGLSSDLVKIDLEQSGGLEEAEVASQSTKKAGKSGDSPPSKRRKSSLGKAMGRMSKILHPSPAKDKKWDELAMSEHSAFRLSVSRLQDSEETTGERILVSVTEQGSQQAQEHTEEREISGQQALQFQPALKAQVEDHDAEYGEEALKSEPKPSRPDRKPRSSRTRSEDGRSSRSEGSRSRISRSPSEVRSSATRSSTSTCSASSRRSRRSTSPSALPADATGSPSRSSQRSNTPSTVSDDAARSPSRSSSRRSKSPFTITSEADEVSSRSSRRSKSPSTLSGEAAKNRSDEDDGSTRKHSSDDGSKLRRKSRSVSPSGLQEDVSKRRRETRSASPSALRGDITKMRDANGDRRISRASRRISTARSGQLDHETLEASTAADFESRIRRASRQASSSKARTPGEAAHEGSLTIETMSPDDGPIFVTAFTGGRVRFADQHLKDVKASKFAFAESQVFEDESEHTLSDTEFETICSMPQLPKSPDRLVLYVKNAGSIIGTADATVRCPSESRTFAERLAAMSTLGRRSDESEVKRVVNPASSSETKRLKKPRASSSNELEDMLKMVGDNGSSKNDQHPRSGDNTSRVSQSTKASRASTKAPRSSGTSEQAGRKRRGSSREEESKTISSRNSDLTGKLALTTGFQGVSW